MLLLHDRGNGVARVNGPKQVHFGDRLQEHRTERAGFCIDGPTSASARIRDEHND